MRIYVFLLTVVWSQMTDGYIRSSTCMNGENGVLKDQKHCENCSCENMSTNDKCTSKFCPCLKTLCSSQVSELKDLIQKFQIKNRSNSDMKTKKDRQDNLYNTDMPDRNNVVYVNDINPDFMIPMDRRHKRNTVQEREQENPILERYFGMNQMIRLMSIDYPMPATQSDTDFSGLLVVLLYSTIIVIGITICIIVYRKYGNSTNSGDLESDNQQAVTMKSLLDDDPPTYEECVV